VSPTAKKAGAGQPDISGAVFLIDGNSLAYRAFYALPESIVTSDGFPTNALYGFTAMLVKIIADYKPAAIIVAWDAGKRVFRHEAFADYKAHRKPTPDNLSLQLQRFDELVGAFGYPSIRKEGYEADDILATLAREARENKQKAVIVTADRDALQLVDDTTFVMSNTKGITDVRVYDRQAVIDRYGIPPELVPDFIGLKGDTSDNIPGVPGIGDKTATALLQQFSSLEDLLSRTAELKGKRRELLEEHAELARMSKELATMNDEVPLEFAETDATPRPPDPGNLRAVLSRFEFNTLLHRLEDMDLLQGPASEVQNLRVAQTEPGKVAAALKGKNRAALAWERHGKNFAVAVHHGGDQVLVAITEPAELIRTINAISTLCSHDFKALITQLLPPAHGDEIQLATPICAHDTAVAAYLLKPTARTYNLEQLAASAGVRIQIIDRDSADRALATAAAQVFQLAALQQAQLQKQGQLQLFTDIEMPLVTVLADMERAGIRVDLARLGELAGKVSDQVDQLADEIRELADADAELNIDSPQQLAAILFDKLQLTPGKKTKTGYSTDATVLKSLRSAHPIIEKIETYRELTKLYNTYLKALPEIADPDTWRIHSTFNQTVTATGRISSSNPNLQNIPIRTPLGEKIRDCFVAAEGHRLVAADYSQVELRIMAHLSEEPKLRQAFAAGDDVHRDTAAEVFGVPAAEVTSLHRNRAKAVNFGIMYGISGFGLAEQLDISREEAAAYIKAYLERYPHVAEFRERIIQAAVKDGFVTTVMGRRRPIPELRAGDPNTRRLGERLAVNTVIQGSAADIMKVAMVTSHRALAERGLKTRLVLQVHDELVFEAPESETEAIAELARDEMASAWKLDPPLVVDVGIGETWLEAK